MCLATSRKRIIAKTRAIHGVEQIDLSPVTDLQWNAVEALIRSSVRPLTGMSIKRQLWGRTRSFGDVGSMSGLPERGHGEAI